MNVAIEIFLNILTAYSLSVNSVFIYVAYAIYSVGFLAFLMLSNSLNIEYTQLVKCLISSIKFKRKIFQTVLWLSIKFATANDQPITNLIFLLLLDSAIEACELATCAFKLSPKHVCFMKKSQIGKSWCGLTSSSDTTSSTTSCNRNNFRHIVECHSDRFDASTNIGFCQASLSSAIKISSAGFKTSKGAFGTGLYFSRSFDYTYRMSHDSGPIIIAQIDLGKSKTLNKRDTEMSLEKLKSDGCDSVYGEAGADLKRPEIVVYEPERVIKWIICL